jgi:hypothetical protein
MHAIHRFVRALLRYIKILSSHREVHAIKQVPLPFVQQNLAFQTKVSFFKDSLAGYQPTPHGLQEIGF